VNAIGPNARLAIGPILRDAIILVLRHWLILLVAWITVFELGLLLLGQFTRCYAAGGWCSEQGQRFFGNSLPEWIVTGVANQLAAFLVLAVALYFLYSSKLSRSGGPAYLRVSWIRGIHFFGRVGLTWTLILLPVWLIDLSLFRLAAAFPEIADAAATRWIVYVLRIAVMASIGALVHARLSLYLPSIAFSGTPASLVDSWQRTRGVAARLFVIFLLIDLFMAGIHTAITFTAYRTSALWGVVDFVAELLNLSSRDVFHSLVAVGADLLMAVPQVLMIAAASLVVFRRLVPQEDRTELDVFN